MEHEAVISRGEGTEDYRHIEVGTQDGRVRLYVEDGAEGMAEVRITTQDAMALMAALGQAIRAA